MSELECKKEVRCQIDTMSPFSPTFNIEYSVLEICFWGRRQDKVGGMPQICFHFCKTVNPILLVSAVMSLKHQPVCIQKWLCF